MKLEKNIMIPMKDGIRLATDLYLPDTEEPVPALINRTPYDKDGTKREEEILVYVNAGYAVVVQDVRGRYHSEGVFVPYENETEDGLTTFEWVRNQPWCTGKYGTFGLSYHGGTQWLPATRNPEGLKAIVPVVTFDDLYNGSAYQDGAKVLHDLRWTAASIIPDIMERARRAGEEVTVDAPEVYNCLDKIPLASDVAIKKYGQYYLTWMKHSTYDDYWKQFSPKEHYGDITVPALNVSGWYDIFVRSTLDNYRGMRDRGGSSDAREYTRVVMGPWTHQDFSGKLNGFDFTDAGSAESLGLTKMKIAWYDHWLKGKPITWDTEKPVQIFVMGENRWRDETDWPLPGTEYQPLYFHSEGNAKAENGTLTFRLPQQEPSDTFIYDPLDPVPTIGGQVILPGEGAMGPRDQRPAEERNDVLVYETNTLQEDLNVIGPLKARLFISSDRTDTDFTVKLTDVDENGISKLLTDGILRVRYRNSLEKTELMEPGTIYEITVDLAATANTFFKGHKLRVSVSSSNFPRFNRNTNSGGSIFFEEKEVYTKATNTVWHDEQHPSCIILPVIR
ncbi:MAG: CocE/NonD family hydrolase [Solobacterium sp.]|nr:CocE/NonD family hydrolase [Solobacterium sp.]